MDDEKPPLLSWDHQLFLIEGRPFYPDLSPDGNCVWASLPCLPHSELNWPLPETSKKIIWKFELGLETPYFPWEDDMRFQALAAALAHFKESIWPQVQSQTLGAVLYQGAFPPQTIEPLSHYVQLLSHRLPDELPLVLAFDPRPLQRPAESLALLAKERFEHFLLAIHASVFWPMPALRWEGDLLFFAPHEARLGICLPSQEQITPAWLEQFESLLSDLDRANTPYRVIPEAFLNEQWDGLDEIYVFPGQLTPLGKRKLLGFEASGGIVKEVRGRGI